MNQYIFSIINRNILWKLRQIIEEEFNSWIYGTDYSIRNSYPENADEVTVYPTFVIDNDTVVSKPYELGAKDRVIFRVEVVIMSDNQMQRDYLNMLLWDKWHNYDYTLYDMSTSEPTVVGDYSALDSLGVYRSFNGRIMNFPVPIKIDDKRMRYESSLLWDIECPNI